VIRKGNPGARTDLAFGGQVSRSSRRWRGSREDGQIGVQDWSEEFPERGMRWEETVGR
jgi:hypothetical protein